MKIIATDFFKKQLQQLTKTYNLAPQDLEAFWENFSMSEGKNL